MATDNLLSTDIISAVIQSGEGIPNHIGVIGTLYIDRNTGLTYQNKDNINTWDQVAYISDLINFSSSGSITGGTFNPSAGTLTFTNSTGGTFNVTGSNLIESNLYKQNSMTYDGTGTYYPTVDAVNIQANNLAKATIQTGFVSVEDGFSLYKFDDNTLGISGSTDGIVFKELFNTPPFAPSSAIVQLTSRLVPLSNIGLTGTTSVIKFVGYRESDDSIIFSNSTFVQSKTICQLGVVLVKYSAGTTSFIDNVRNFINQPDIAAYSNLDTTSTGVKSNVIVDKFSTGLTISNTSGSLIGISVNWHGDNNDLLPISGQTSSGTTFVYLYPGLFTSTAPLVSTTFINPTQYWNGSALTQVGIASAATIQRFLVNIRGAISVQYGEMVYPSFANAQSNVWVQQFTDVLPVGTFAEVGRLVVTSGCTDLSNITTAAFYTAPAGGSNGGSSGGSGSGITGSNIFVQDIVVSLSGGKTMGKYLNGQTIQASGKTFEQVIRDIAIEYLTPTFASFSIVGQTNPIEVGATLSGVKPFTWSFNNSSNVSANTVSIIDVTSGNTVLASSLSNTPPANLDIGVKSNLVPISQAWKATAIDTNSNLLTSSNYTVTSIYPYFYGVSASPPTANQALINSGTKVVTSSVGTISVTFGASLQYLWFAIPQTSTDKTKWFVDALNNGNIGTGSDLFNNDTIVSINSPTALWSGINYRIYISNYATTTSGVMQLQN